MATGAESTGIMPALFMKLMLQCGYAALVCEAAFFREVEFLVSSSTFQVRPRNFNNLERTT